jgi:hypothetical protein
MEKRHANVNQTKTSYIKVDKEGRIDHFFSFFSAGDQTQDLEHLDKLSTAEP